jgi:hypothetical protein
MIDRRSLLLAGLGVAGMTMLTAPSLGVTREQIRIRDLYQRVNEFSDLAHELTGQRIEIRGFMAPPLKPEAQFFVLTSRPMAVCPFCESEADWPNDIVLVKMQRQQDWVYFNIPIVTEGVLELGVEVDEETGFVSLVRLVDARFERVG